jgi:hypothetical protein
MLRETALSFLVAVSLGPIALAAPLSGEVSEEGQDRIPRQEGNVSEQMPAAAPDRRNGSVQSQGSDQNQPLVGNLNDFATPAQAENPRMQFNAGAQNQQFNAGAQNQRTQLNAGAQNQLSALGIAFKFSSGMVNLVDPGSDLYGRIFPGDRILSYDGMSPLDSYRSGSNFGNAGTIVQLTFEHQGVVSTMPCRRKPVTEFSPAFQSQLNWGALRR